MTSRRRAGLVRAALFALTVVGILATAFELASERHWNSSEQLIPWVALAVLTVATVLTALRARGAQLISRVLVLAVLGASAYGVLDHIAVNHDSGPLDQRYADTWESMPATQQWWYAATKTVGPAPTLAPGVLAQTSLLLLLAGLIKLPPREPEA
ncbi:MULTISPECIES: hypothetical protein [unclassified Mycolicibacterium]|uniref:hypothetical protein n=1 Tax=unclassified Mycolicibacterium TaxID=2636767 RepID=UPI002ED8CCA7